MKHPSVVLESRDFFWHPEISDHNLIERFCPWVFDGVQVKKSGGRTLDDGSDLHFVFSERIKEEILLHFVEFLRSHRKGVYVICLNINTIVE